MRVIFDLDGTLANSEHRVHHLIGETKDWRAFYAACETDEPMAAIVSIFNALAFAGHSIQIWTGRSAEVEGETHRWLRRHGLGNVELRMRPIGDHRPDIDLKAEWLNSEPVKPDLVFEDRASVVAMWRANGIVCAQVAPGDF